MRRLLDVLVPVLAPLFTLLREPEAGTRRAASAGDVLRPRHTLPRRDLSIEEVSGSVGAERLRHRHHLVPKDGRRREGPATGPRMHVGAAHRRQTDPYKDLAGPWRPERILDQLRRPAGALEDRGDALGHGCAGDGRATSGRRAS